MTNQNNDLHQDDAEKQATNYTENNLPEREKMQNREVDKKDTAKTKKYLWNVLTDRFSAAKSYKAASIWSTIFTPFRISLAGATVILLVFAILFTQNGPSILQHAPSNHAYAAFEMVADHEDSAGINQDATFTIKTTSGMSADELQKSLEITPSIEFSIKSRGDGEFSITPKEDLQPNTVYSFAIKGTKERFSWAYQVKSALKVASSVPGDKTNYVPIDTGIEFRMNQEGLDLDSFEDNFEISPKVDGKFEVVRDRLIFIPKKTLEYNSIYTVNLKAGVRLKDKEANLKLKNDYIIQFHTEEKESNDERNENNGILFRQDEYTSVPNTPLVVDINSRFWNLSEDELALAESKKYKATIYQFEESNSYKIARKNLMNRPGWVYYNYNETRKDEYIVKDKIKNLAKLGDFYGNLHDSITGYGKVLMFEDALLPEGQYLIQMENPNFSQALVQVTPIATYVTVTTTDTLIWVNNVLTKTPIEDAQIYIAELDKTITTDKNGIATFKTSFSKENQNHLQYDDDLDFYYGGDSSNHYNFTITKDKSQLITTANYSNWWVDDTSYWYSFDFDRPVYQPIDTVKFFGFVKPKSGESLNGEVTIEISNYDDKIVTQKAIINNSTFLGQFDIKNLLPGDYYANVYYKDKNLGGGHFSVKNYVKPAYTISISSDKTNYFNGETAYFDIETKFFDGTPLAYKKIKYDYYLNTSLTGEVTTDKNGKAHVSIDLNNDDQYSSSPKYVYVRFSSGAGEESDISESKHIVIHNTDLHIESDQKKIGDKGIATVHANYIDFDVLNARDTNEDFEYNYGDEFKKPAKNKLIHGELQKITSSQEKNGTYYDYIAKKNIQKYRTIYDTQTIEEFELITDKNGEAIYKIDMPDSDNVHYQVYFKIEDDFGHKLTTSQSFYKNSGYNYSYGKGESIMYSVFFDNPYTDDWKTLFKIGDTIKASIGIEGYGDESTLIKDTPDMRYLFLELNEGLIGYSVEDTPKYNTKFTEKDIPAVKIDGVIFNGRTYVQTFDSLAEFDTKERELNIKLINDKENYEPGDFVEMTIKTTDKDGKPLSSQVQLNLIDEAYYKAIYDNINNPLEDLYNYAGDGVLTQESTHKDLMPMTEDMAMSDAVAGGRGGCFVSGTQILLSNGNTKNIEDIVIGDMISTKEGPYSSKMVNAEVKNTVKHYVNEHLLINEKLKITSEHVLLVNGKWDVAGNIRTGDYLTGADNSLIQVRSIELVKSPVYVYNFEVEKYHTYIADGYYVHNDKGGDGIRNDFEDNALFEIVQTDKNGNGKIKFQLPDNITSWRVTAKAFEVNNIYAGMETSAVNVTMPMFITTVDNKEYSIKDKPYFKAIAYGTSIMKDEIVEFTYGDVSKTANAFEPVYFAMDALKMGTNSFIVSAKTGSLKDAIEQKFEVVGSRLKQTFVEDIADISNGQMFNAEGDGRTNYTIMRSDISPYYSLMSHLAYSNGLRVDQKPLSVMSKTLLNKYFNIGYDVEEPSFIDYQKENGGISQLPYGSADLKLTALYGLVTGGYEGFDIAKVKAYLKSQMRSSEVSSDEYLYSLAGLAVLHENVLQDLRKIDLTSKEYSSSEQHLTTALALNAIGDAGSAQNILDSFSDPMKLDVQDRALYAVVAASLKDTSADKVWRDTDFEGISKDILNLYKFGFAQYSLQGINEVDLDKETKFKIEINGEVKDAVIHGNGSYYFTLLSGSTAKITEIADNKLKAIKVYEKTVEPSEFETDSRLSITRKYYVNGKETTKFHEGDVVEVEIIAKENQYIKDSGYVITDILPSGLKPIASQYNAYGYYSYNDDDKEFVYTHPHSIDKQEIKFYTWGRPYSYYNDDNGDKQIKYEPARYVIRYNASVITPGQYYAEPAKMQSIQLQNVATIGDGDMVEIVVK